MALGSSNGRLSPQEYEVASWWVEHRLQVRQAGFGLAIAVLIGIWGYGVWGFLDAYAFSYPRESRLARQIADAPKALISLEQDRPRPTSPGSATVLTSTDQRVDFFSTISNPNAQWWATFTYRFQTAGGLTAEKNGVVLPGQTQQLSYLGYRPEGGLPSAATLIIERFQWHRLEPTFGGPSFQDFSQSRWNTHVSDVTVDSVLTADAKTITQTRFTIQNDSAYGFWEVHLFVKLFRADQVLAVQDVTIEQLKPHETRPVSISWFESLPGVTRVEVIPFVNILDPEVYLPTTRF